MAKFIYYITLIVVGLIMNEMLGLTFHNIEWWLILIALIVCRICGEEEKKK